VSASLGQQDPEHVAGIHLMPPLAPPTADAPMPREQAARAQQRFRDIRYRSEPERGGHFAAFEQPELFVDEVGAFFRLVS
jgi:hypothetical protein